MLARMGTSTVRGGIRPGLHQGGFAREGSCRDAATAPSWSWRDGHRPDRLSCEETQSGLGHDARNQVPCGPLWGDIVPEIE